MSSYLLAVALQVLDYDMVGMLLFGEANFIKNIGGESFLDLFMNANVKLRSIDPQAFHACQLPGHVDLV